MDGSPATPENVKSISTDQPRKTPRVKELVDAFEKQVEDVKSARDLDSSMTASFMGAQFDSDIAERKKKLIEAQYKHSETLSEVNF